MQMAMVKIWLNQRQPQKALTYLQGFNPSFLRPDEVQQIKQLAAIGRQHIEAGITDMI